MILDTHELEARIQTFGGQLFEELKGARLGLLDPDFYTGKLMDWAMKDPAFKVSLFRFVDVLPSLPDSASIIRHAQEYFSSAAERIPGLLKWGLKVDPDSLSAKMAARVVVHQVKSMAGRFIVGETPNAGMKRLREIRGSRSAFVAVLLGEEPTSEAEALVYLDRYLELLDVLNAQTPKWRESRPLVEGHRTEVTPIHIAVKPTVLYSQIKAVAYDKSISILAERLAQVFDRAMQYGAFVTVDMEDCSMVDITIESVKRVLELDRFRGCDRFGVVLQAYLRRTEEDLNSLIAWAQRRGCPLGVRLVKGAYWDMETIIAKQNGWSIPVWTMKSSTDATYERCALKLLENHKHIIPAFGSHNLRSLAFVVKAAELLGVPTTDYELQALYGMADPLKKLFTTRGFLVREYAPIGEMLPGMSYLVRRLLENTSNEGFLRQSFYEGETAEILLKAPQWNSADNGSDHLHVDARQAFFNTPNTDFTLADARKRFASCVDAFKGRVRTKPEVVRPVIAGEYVASERTLQSISPEDPNLVLADVSLATPALANQAVERLQAYFPTWRDTSAEVRAEILFRAADLFEKRRAEICACMVLEGGKPWVEADVELSEAVDFCRYYAHEALELSRPQKMGNYPGELNTYFYEPRGVTAVISPWNFPLAIPTGMFVAALVTGNCAILKPAEQTSLVAREIYDTLIAAGLPPQAAAFLPGYGEDVGSELVNHPLVTTIAFTGSKAVGFSILGSTGKIAPNAPQIKRVVCEMGGKNAIIVDDDADLDKAIPGVFSSAFGFAGQKCSACSRVIAVGAIYDRVLERLKDGARDIRIGPPSDPATSVGPVIDEEAWKRITDTIAAGRQRGTVVVEGGDDTHGVFNAVPRTGFFIRPTIFSDLPSEDPILTDEIFGPVLALIRAKSFEEAIAIACSSEYALTGAVYSRSPRNLEYALREFRVGNLYINRGSTGALVMRQPFGGFKMSGGGTKAGGPDYLLQFVNPRSVSENTIRRGFAPE